MAFPVSKHRAIYNLVPSPKMDSKPQNSLCPFAPSCIIMPLSRFSLRVTVSQGYHFNKRRASVRKVDHTFFCSLHCISELFCFSKLQLMKCVFLIKYFQNSMKKWSWKQLVVIIKLLSWKYPIMAKIILIAEQFWSTFWDTTIPFLVYNTIKIL